MVKGCVFCGDACEEDGGGDFGHGCILRVCLFYLKVGDVIGRLLNDEYAFHGLPVSGEGAHVGVASFFVGEFDVDG